MGNSIVWVSGATQGIGAGLARLAARDGARVVNLDVAQSDEFETIAFDLARLESLDAIDAHFTDTLSGGEYDSATLLVVGHATIGQGMHSLVDIERYRTSLVANAVAPIMLGTLFLRCLPRNVRGGLMMMSSGAAAWSVLGQSSYSACKCAIEGWVRVIRDEIAHEERDVWVTAVRPGLVETPSARSTASEDIALYPRAKAMGNMLDKIGVSVDVAAERIWKHLPPTPEARVLSFDGRPEKVPELVV